MLNASFSFVKKHLQRKILGIERILWTTEPLKP
jgi:hypothetical protein